MTLAPAAELHRFDSAFGSHVLVVDGSRIYDVPQETTAEELWSALGLFSDAPAQRRIDGTPLHPPPLHSISLNVAQACNMSCGYCYADEGRFGGRARTMGLDVARATVDRLIAESAPGANLVLGYMGGEPLLRREVVHETTRYAMAAAARAGRRIRFSLTTNATLLTPADAELFAAYPFTVAVSIDGDRAANDAVRRMRSGASAYDRLRAGLAVLKAHGRPQHLAARVTVTARSGPLLPILDHALSLGFDEVGFAAVLVSPDAELALAREDFPLLLERMVQCGEKALAEIAAGREYPFGNLETALQEIHRGTHRPYPCGAGASYLSANADGDLYACHRLVDDPRYAMGSVREGSDVAARAAHLERSHVDRMEPCRTCWARYLCGGGCYHEVANRGRPGCDYIRGWLDFCLRAYVELSSAQPQRFAHAAPGRPDPIFSPTTLAT